MKKVRYKKLKITNFLSIGNEPVEVEFKPGINVITGRNLDKVDRQNGVGKSTIADAFFFAHFGETIRKIKKELIANDYTSAKVEVSLHVDVEQNGSVDSYIICRYLRPSKVQVFKNGQDVTLDSIANTNNYIAEVLSMNENVMLNCVVTTLNETSPFMAKSKAEKRKFIEDIFDLDVFGRMLTLLKRDFSETKKTVEIKDAQVGEIKRTVQTLQENQQKLITQRNERIAHYEERRNKNIAEKEQLIKEIAENVPEDPAKIVEMINKLRTAYDKLLSLVEKQTVAIQKNISVGSRYSLEIDRIRRAITEGTCVQCMRAVDSQDIDHYDKHIAEVQAKWEATRVEREQLEAVQRDTIAKRDTIYSKIAELQEKRATVIQLFEEQKTRTKRLESIDGWIKELEKDIETARNAQDTFAEGIKREGTRLKTQATELSEVKEHFKVLDSARFVLGDEGVKTHIVKKLIDLLNTKLTYYIRKLDGNCICKFNEYFEEEIISNKNKVRSYFNFSGAEKKAVDLAGLFAFADIKRLQGGVSYNVSFYDELFDTALDETAVNLVLDILQDKVDDNDECVFIISHRKEAIKAVTGEVIYLEKHNEITRRVDYREEPS